MNLLVILVNDIIVKVGICPVLLDPCLFNGYILPHLILRSLVAEIFRAEIQQEFLVRLETLKSRLVLVDLALCLGNLLVELLDLLLLAKLLAVERLLLVFFLFLHLLVSCDVLMQVHLVVLELLRRFYERLVATLLPFFKLLDLLLDCVVGELSKEHLLLLVDELSGILGALLFGELHTSLGHHHCPVDVLLLLLIVSRLFILSAFVALSGRDVAVFDAM